MAGRRGDLSGKRSLRVEMAAGDFEVLDEACRMFGLGKSELVRRLVRASVDVGPALSVEGLERVDVLAGQVRIVGRNLMQVLRAIHRGAAVGIAGSEPVWRGLQEMIADLDAELSAWAEASGASSAALRRRAGLVARVVDAKATGRFCSQTKDSAGVPGVPAPGRNRLAAE